MAQKAEYAGTIFGDLKIPCFELHENLVQPYKESDIIIEKSSAPFEIPDPIVRSYKDRLAEERAKDAALHGRKYFDNPAARLVSYSVDDDKHQLHLNLQDAMYSDFSATNKSIDNPLVKTMVSQRGSDMENLNDGLANAIGVNVNLLSEPDNSIVIIERSPALDQYPGLYGIPAGFFNPKKSDYNPFNIAKSEAHEEVGVPIEEINMFGLDRACDDRHIEVLMTAKTPYTKEKILSAPKSGKWEGKIKPENIIDFEPKKIMKLLTKTVSEEPKGVPKGTNYWVPGQSPAWAPAHWKAVQAELINQFGFDEVWNAYEEARRTA